MQIPVWYSVSQIAISAYTSIVILLLWYRGEPEKTKSGKDMVERDDGVLWLGLAVFSWAIIAFFVYWNIKSGLLSEDNTEKARALFSTINSAFFLISISFFDYGALILKKFRERFKYWKLILFGGCMIVFFIALKIPSSYRNFVKIPDIVLAAVTLFLLGKGLFGCFKNRGFPLLAYFSSLAIVWAFAAQLLELPFITENLLHKEMDWVGRFIFGITYKSVLITLILALLVSWSFEGWEKYAGKKIVLTGGWGALLTLPPKKHKETLTPALYAHLLDFVVKRLNEDPATGGWFTLGKIKDGKEIDVSQVERIYKNLKVNEEQIFEREEGPAQRRLDFKPTNIVIMPEVFAINDDRVKSILSKLNQKHIDLFLTASK